MKPVISSLVVIGLSCALALPGSAQTPDALPGSWACVMKSGDTNQTGMVLLNYDRDGTWSGVWMMTEDTDNGHVRMEIGTSGTWSVTGDLLNNQVKSLTVRDIFVDGQQIPEEVKQQATEDMERDPSSMSGDSTITTLNDTQLTLDEQDASISCRR